MKKKELKFKDFHKEGDAQLAGITIDELIPLPPPYDRIEEQRGWKTITEEQKESLVCNLDGFIALGLPKPANKEEERKYVKQFVSGLKKLLNRENNWTFLQPLLLSIDYCARCQTCNDSCPIYIASGKNDLYRPTYRSEIFRRLINKYMKQIALEVGIGKNVTTYYARHSFATVLKRSGAKIEMISELLGHSSVDVTESYLDGSENEQIQKETDVLIAGFNTAN